MVASGDRLPVPSLIEVDLGPIHLSRMLHTGPVVLMFIRHAASTTCETALRGYRHTLAPVLADLSAHFVAVSPQAPDRLAGLKHRNDIDFLVASDPRHVLIDALNIGFACPEAERALGTRRGVLPYAAMIVADRTGIVRLATVQPDWSHPVDPALITAAVTGTAPERGPRIASGVPVQHASGPGAPAGSAPRPVLPAFCLG